MKGNGLMRVADLFVCRTRADGTTYVAMLDDSPEWLRDAVRDAHGDEWPNDWVYDACRGVCESFHDGLSEPGEIADGLCDVYNGALARWLADDPINRAEWVDDAADEFCVAGAGLFDRLRAGQFLQLCMVAGVIVDAIEEHTDGTGIVDGVS